MADSGEVGRFAKLSALSNLQAIDKQKKKSEVMSGAGGIKMENSSKDNVQQSNILEVAVMEQRKENKRLQDEIENRKERFLKREAEYRKIIQDLQSEIRHKAMPNEANENRKMEEAKEYHQLIMENIDNIQLKTSKIILDQEKDILRFFNNKITEIKKQFEEERIKKGKKDQDYVEKELKLTSKLEWIKNIAQKIDNENHNLMKKYMDLKSQYQTQENDREMLLKELIMKKKKNAILKSQLEQYELLMNEATNDNQDFEDQARATSSSKKFRSINPNLQSDSKGLEKRSLLDRPLHNFGESQMSSSEQLLRSEKTLKNLQSTLKKEQRRVRDLKMMYLKEVESKSDLELIIKNNVDKIIKTSQNKTNGVPLNAKGPKTSSNPRENFTKEMRQILIDQLLNDEKVLTLVYDKTFYPDFKNIQVDDHVAENQSNNNEADY